MSGPLRFRTKNKDCAFAQFAPDEIASILNVRPGMSETWGYRGFPDWQEGKSDVAAADVTFLALKHRLASMGCGPQQCDLVAGRANSILFYFAFLAVDGAIQVTGLPDRLEIFKQDFRRDDSMAAELTGGPPYYRYLYRFDGQDEFKFGANLDMIMRKPKSSAMALIDLQVLAIELCARMRRPLLHITLMDDRPESEMRQTWLSGRS